MITVEQTPHRRVARDDYAVWARDNDDTHRRVLKCADKVRAEHTYPPRRVCAATARTAASDLSRPRRRADHQCRLGTRGMRAEPSDTGRSHKATRRPCSMKVA